jgi:3-(3-hydroxy-phenyl)propionate hydroxylase
MVPGAVGADAPLQRADGSRTWLLRELTGAGFTLLLFDDDREHMLALPESVGLLRIASADAPADAPLRDVDGLLAQRYDLHPGNAVLFRPDQHVCARWRRPTAEALRAALARALTPARMEALPCI